MDKPIPAFYACYLLRSTIRHASLYVGSTPNPVRRLKQHNGESKGGAVRTSRDSLRPWEMACLVTGFPSKIAALQFEWAWQNTHLTRHIPSEARLARGKQVAKSKLSPKAGRTRRRPPRPRLCLTDRLANLHLLLQARSFKRWPLKVTFYAEDVWRVWSRWIGQHLELQGGNGLREGIWVGMGDSMKVANSTSSDLTTTDTPKGIHALDVTHAPLKPQLEKSRNLLEHHQNCTLCSSSLPPSGANTLICPSPSCTATTHLSCLASHFLASNNDTTSILPTTGTCPICATPLQWQDLVKELSLRMRGEKEIHALFKPARGKKRKAGDETSTAAVDAAKEDAEESETELAAELALDDEDVWHHLSGTESELEEAPAKVIPSASSSSKTPAFRKAREFKPRPAGPEVVVEDSDVDEVEIIA